MAAPPTLINSRCCTGNLVVLPLQPDFAILLPLPDSIAVLLAAVALCFPVYQPHLTTLFFVQGSGRPAQFRGDMNERGSGF